jgi:hypothetical protein
VNVRPQEPTQIDPDAERVAVELQRNTAQTLSRGQQQRQSSLKVLLITREGHKSFHPRPYAQQNTRRSTDVLLPGHQGAKELLPEQMEAYRSCWNSRQQE